MTSLFMPVERKNYNFLYGNVLYFESFMKATTSEHMKKINLYVPGLLSLLLLFPMLMHQLVQWPVFQKDYIMEVNWYDPRWADRLGREFPPSKDYVIIHITGNTSDDSASIAYAKVILTKMIVAFDTTRGVCIHLDDKAKYESFIEVLKFCDKQDALVYAPYGSDFWVYNRFANEESKAMLWGSCIWSPRVSGERNMSWAYSYDIDKKYWPIGLAFLLLVTLNFRRIKDRHI